jgi:hypothetical protein
MTIERPLSALTATEAAIEAEVRARLTPEDVILAGWGDWQRMFWVGSVFFVLACLVLVLAFFVGDMHRNGYLAWLPDNLGTLLAGMGIGGGTVAAVKTK